MVEIGSVPTLQRGSFDDARVCVVLLHGYGMQASDLAPFADSLGVPAVFLFPQGPWACPGGGRSWWRRDELAAAAAQAVGPRDLANLYPEGRLEARALLSRYLNAIAPMQGSRPLLLAGFSQGGMLACDLLLHEETKVDALALFSSSRIAFEDWRPRLPRLKDLPALVSHGRDDADLAFAAGEALRDALVEGGASVDWVAFDGGHEIQLPVWRALRRLIRRLAAASPGG